MTAEEVARYCKVPAHLIRDWMGRSPSDVYRDQQYIRTLYRLDLPYLRATLPRVREFYAENLDSFAEDMEQRYQIARGAMSSFTLGNWVVAFLDHPEYSLNMIERHNHLPSELFGGGLESLMLMLEDLPEGKEQWQQALCLLTFPLMNL